MALESEARADTSLELQVHVPAVSPREHTGTAALMRGIPPGARGGIQILLFSFINKVVDVLDVQIVLVPQGQVIKQSIFHGSWRKSLASLESSSDF